MASNGVFYMIANREKIVVTLKIVRRLAKNRDELNTGKYKTSQNLVDEPKKNIVEVILESDYWQK